MQDWSNEVEALKGGAEFLKLSSGQHKIRFLGEGEPKTVQWEGKDINKVFFPVELLDLSGVSQGEYVWSVTKGQTINSLYGQIALVGRDNGKLEGQVISVIRKGEGKASDYTVVEALNLIKQEVQSRKVVTEKV